MTAAGLNLPEVGEAALQAAIKMLLIDGFFHADPHPGNLLVDLNTGVVNFLDCGMVGELTIPERFNLVVLLWEFVEANVEGMGRQLRNLSVAAGPIDEHAFERDYVRRMNRFGPGANADLKQVLPVATGVLRDHGLRLDPDLTLALKAMGQASAFFTRLAPPDRTFTAAALDAAMEQGKEALNEEAVTTALKHQAGSLAGQAMKAAPDYLRGLFSWKDQLKKGRLEVYVNTDSINNQMDSIRAITQSFIVALLVAGALIGSAIVMTTGTKSGISPNVTRFGTIGFIVSLCLAVVLSLIYLTRSFRRPRSD